MRALATAALVFVSLVSRAGEELPPEWPDVSTFTPGKETRFRLPFFAGLLTYPEGEPLYNVLQVPSGYDPRRAYPLCIRFQPQGGKPGVYEFKRISGGDAFVLGVSWPLYKIEPDKLLYMPSGEKFFYPATAQWVFANFNIDRSRVFVGGFSAGGWSAASCGMTINMRHVSTHFVILSSGIRGKYRTELFKGSPAFVGVGTEGMNCPSAKSAASKLRGAKFDVTYVEAPGVGHSIGDPVWKGLAEWWKRFDPKARADEWLKEAEQFEKRNKARACELYARVATLGDGDPRGRAARGKLEELEGKALDKYEKAYSLLRARDYVGAKKALKEAYREAARKRSGGLVKLCTARAAEVDEWMFCEQAMATAETYWTGRVYESCLLAQDGSARYALKLKRWAQLFKDDAKSLVKKAPAAAQKAGKRARAQQKLARARVMMWSGKASLVKKDLEKIARDYPAKPEGVDAKMLLRRISPTAGPSR